MSAEVIMAALLSAPQIADAVGGRIALVETPQDEGFPALVYSIVSDNALGKLCGPATSYRARVQINPLAPTQAQIIGIHALVRAEIESTRPQSVAGRRVVACYFVGYGPTSKDEFSAQLTKPADYMLTYE